MFNHAFTVAFTVRSKHKNPDKISDKKILTGMAERVAYLIERPEEICQACDPYDVYKEQKPQATCHGPHCEGCREEGSDKCHKEKK